MQVVASPFSTPLTQPHYHPYFQIQPPDHELKRQYLSLLPPKQIIEICLTFDPYVPPYAKTTIWPLDLNAAIANLQSTTSGAGSSAAGKSKDGPVIGNHSEAEESSSTKTGEPPPPDVSASGTVSAPSAVDESQVTSSEVAQNTSSEIASESQPAQPSSSSTIHVPTDQQAQPVLPLQSYPHQTYGYGHPHPYPHTPYYPSAYPYPYTYPPPSGFHASVSGATPYNPNPPYGGMPLPPQPRPDSMGGDDLPSYEEMIVEALSECTDPEGSMPKDLFAWMAARYPLQSNFRPSASQALQKAYKRGRFEKATSGKYRLNATWEGGSSSRRTTRRPQTQSHAASGPANRTPVAPFTHAPLIHHRNASASQPPYPPHPFGFPTYGSQQISPTANPGVPATPAEPLHSVSKSGSAAVSTSESAAAYEAAQSILKAINFGSLLKLPPEDSEKSTEETGPQPDGSGIEHLLSHVHAVLASRASEETNMNSAPLPPPAGESTVLSALPIPQPATDTRAELQAQLALLSAQLVELAHLNQLPAEESHHVVMAAPIPPMHSLSAEPPASQLPSVTSDVPSTSASSHIDTSQTVDNPESTTMPQDDGESDEDDMEEVI